MASDLCKAYGLQQVVILCKDLEGVQHIVTAGKTKADCREAGLSGDQLKLVLAWPEETLSKYTKHVKSLREAESKAGPK